jgi:hypothetical protein
MNVLKRIWKKITRIKRKESENPIESISSNFDESLIIDKYLSQFNDTNKFCVDIAASDGVSMSNTYDLFKKGYNGIAVEFDSEKFSKLAKTYKVFNSAYLVKTKVTPHNINHILKSCFCPKDFDFLNLDIDSYEYFVLDEMFKEFRPKLICLEINEKIPPPIKFTVLYDETHWWKGDHFFGLSISKAYELCIKYNYSIVELEYNNLFLIPNEININNSLSPEIAYENGYKNRIDRKEKMPYNFDMEELLSLSKEDSIVFINEYFAKYKGKYTIE